MANSLVPEAVARFRALWPGVTVDVMAFATKEVIERFARNEADLGIADTPVRDPDLRVEELCEVQMVCVMRADHPLAGPGRVRVSDLLAEPVIAFSEDTMLGRAIREALNERNPRYQVASTINQSTVACALVGQGVGVRVDRPVSGRRGAFGRLTTRPFIPRILVRPAILRRVDRPPSQPGPGLRARTACDRRPAGRPGQHHPDPDLSPASARPSIAFAHEGAADFVLGAIGAAL